MRSPAETPTPTPTTSLSPRFRYSPELTQLKQTFAQEKEQLLPQHEEERRFARIENAEQVEQPRQQEVGRIDMADSRLVDASLQHEKVLQVSLERWGSCDALLLAHIALRVWAETTAYERDLDMRAAHQHESNTIKALHQSSLDKAMLAWDGSNNYVVRAITFQGWHEALRRAQDALREQRVASDRHDVRLDKALLRWNSESHGYELRLLLDSWRGAVWDSHRALRMQELEAQAGRLYSKSKEDAHRLMLKLGSHIGQEGLFVSFSGWRDLLRVSVSERDRDLGIMRTQQRDNLTLDKALFRWAADHDETLLRTVVSALHMLMTRQKREQYKTKLEFKKRTHDQHLAGILISWNTEHSGLQRVLMFQSWKDLVREVHQQCFASRADRVRNRLESTFKNASMWWAASDNTVLVRMVLNRWEKHCLEGREQNIRNVQLALSQRDEEARASHMEWALSRWDAERGAFTLRGLMHQWLAMAKGLRLQQLRYARRADVYTLVVRLVDSMDSRHVLGVLHAWHKEVDTGRFCAAMTGSQKQGEVFSQRALALIANRCTRIAAHEALHAWNVAAVRQKRLKEQARLQDELQRLEIAGRVVQEDSMRHAEEEVGNMRALLEAAKGTGNALEHRLAMHLISAEQGILDSNQDNLALQASADALQKRCREEGHSLAELELEVEMLEAQRAASLDAGQATPSHSPREDAEEPRRTFAHPPDVEFTIGFVDRKHVGQILADRFAGVKRESGGDIIVTDANAKEVTSKMLPTLDAARFPLRVRYFSTRPSTGSSAGGSRGIPLGSFGHMVHEPAAVLTSPSVQVVVAPATSFENTAGRRVPRGALFGGARAAR